MQKEIDVLSQNSEQENAKLHTIANEMKNLKEQRDQLVFNDLTRCHRRWHFPLLVSAIILLSFREWLLLLSRRKPAVLHETEPVWLPDYA